jgi:hypothetical protein
VLGDTIDEANETFFVNLLSPVNATITDGQGVGTITNDDVAPSLAISDVTVAEGNAGITNAVFTVSLSNPSGQAVTVDFATADAPRSRPATTPRARARSRSRPGRPRSRSRWRSRAISSSSLPRASSST